VKPPDPMRRNSNNSYFQRNNKFQVVLSMTLALLYLTCLGHANAQTHKQILITTEELIPTSMSNDGGKTVMGRTADKIHEMMHRGGIPYQIEMMNWNRAYELARTQPDTCVFSLAYTVERAPYFKWVGPISKGTWVVVGPKEKLGKITQLSQIKEASIGVELGDVINEYLRNRHYNVVNSSYDDISLKNLIVGRLDFLATDLDDANARIAKGNLKDQVTALFTFNTVDYYLACNPQIDNDVIDKMKLNLKKIKTDGTAEKIDAKY